MSAQIEGVCHDCLIVVSPDHADVHLCEFHSTARSRITAITRRLGEYHEELVAKRTLLFTAYVDLGIAKSNIQHLVAGAIRELPKGSATRLFAERLKAQWGRK